MDCELNVFWPQELPVLNNVEDSTMLLQSENAIVPLIMEEEARLDSANIKDLILKGNGRFKLQSGFSIEHTFAMGSGVNLQGVSVRFIRMISDQGGSEYCGLIFCNSNKPFRYHVSDKSIQVTHVHKMLHTLANIINGRKDNQEMDFHLVTVNCPK